MKTNNSSKIRLLFVIIRFHSSGRNFGCDFFFALKNTFYLCTVKLTLRPLAAPQHKKISSAFGLLRRCT